MLVEGLQEALELFGKSDKAMDCKRLLICMALEKYKEALFDSGVIDRVRTDLRIICKQAVWTWRWTTTGG